MSNVHFGIVAVLGAMVLVFGLMALIPQGMWLYLGAIIWGTATVTFAISSLEGEE